MSDPLMNVDFDAVAYINERFSTEASLSGLDTFLLGVNTQIGVLEDEISQAVQTQSMAGQKASIQIKEAEKYIDELFTKMGDIRSKAVSSEKMVQEICSDIKKLDIAKTHLQMSITSLKRLQMLITAINQLEILAQDFQYREAANLLDAVKQLLGSFDQVNYNSIPIISEMRERVSVIQAHLKKHAHRAFREIGQLVDSVAASAAAEMVNELPGSMKTFSDACLVVDSLGIAARRELLEEFVQLQLVPYESLFSIDKQHFTLDQVERRWAWCKRLLKNVDNKFARICPTHWRLALRLCLEFTERTKLHLTALLTKLEASDSIDVHTLLKALQSTLRFEQEMKLRFQSELSCAMPNAINKDENIEVAKSSESQWKGKSGNTLDSKQLQEQGQVLYIPTNHATTTAEDSEEQGFLRIAYDAIVGDKAISGTFDKFLGSYVLLERQNLEDMLMRLSSEEDTADATAERGEQNTSGVTVRGNVFGSSMSMFVFIKNSIKRCTVFSTGITFLSLSKELKVCMQQYGELLRNRCPASQKVPSIFPTGGATSVFYPVTPGSEKTICYIINTGEYCADVVPQLESMIKNTITDNLRDRVDFETECDLFMDLVAHALKVLVSGIMWRINDAFRSMAAISWSTVNGFSEESPYVRQISKVLLEVVPIVRSSLGEGYFNTFCTKLASAILDIYLEVLVKQKRITEVATQQLLLDVYNIKTLLSTLHTLSPTDETAAGTRKAPPIVYAKLVTSRTGHIETILKLVGTPDEQGMLLERFRILWPEGKPADLQLVTRLKGLNQKAQTQILESFGLTAAAAASFSANDSSSQSSTFTNMNMGISQGMRRYGSELSGSIKKLGLS
jgi:vacuolar protein sorting-associated protein 53